jgi:hypothetical protein
MNKLLRMLVLAIGLVAAATAGAWRAEAQEKHPVLRNSIRQLEAIKDRLQKAPSDFGGHRVAAIQAIDHAVHELNEAIKFDSK